MTGSFHAENRIFAAGEFEDGLAAKPNGRRRAVSASYGSASHLVIRIAHPCPNDP